MRKHKQDLTFNIYTDASMLNPDIHFNGRNVDPEKLKDMKAMAGYGVYIELNKMVYPEGPDIAPFQVNNVLTKMSGNFDLIIDITVCEMYAILRSLQYINELVDKKYLDKDEILNINIFTDSKFSERLLNDNLDLDPSVQKYYTYFFQLKNQILNLEKDLPVNISWVKSHNNIDGNEIADQLARKGKYMKVEKVLESLNILRFDRNEQTKRFANEQTRHGILSVNPFYGKDFKVEDKIALNIEKQVENMKKEIPKKFERFKMTGTMKKF